MVENAWDEAGILPMAIRMRKAGNCPSDIDNLYGEIMVEITKMGSLLLLREDPRYECHRREFMSDDIQMHILMQVLVAAEKYVDTRQKPKSIVNYLTKTVQNRLRNYVRDSENRKAKIDIVFESELGCDLATRCPSVSSLDGRMIDAEINQKLCTTNFN